MTPQVQLVTGVLSVGAVGLLVGAAILFGLLVVRRPKTPALLAVVGRMGVPLACAVGVFGVLGSLYYSEVAGFAPCLLCWWQRILFYPLVLILGVATLRRERSIVPYALALALPGIALALYHVGLQYGTLPEAPCGVTGVSCGVRYFNTFGFVTLPFLSFAGFTGITALLLAARRAYARP